MKNLVYIGCNQGYSLHRLIGQYHFDKILLIDADTDAIAALKHTFKGYNNMIVLNTCLVGDESIKEVKFNINPNRATNSILAPKFCTPAETITMKASFLPSILQEHGIDEIDLYISDLQGKDLEVLSSLSKLLDAKKIKELFVETYNDKNPFYFDANNHIKDYVKLLDDNYKMDYISSDGRLLGDNEVRQFLTNEDIGEADVHWSLKDKTVQYKVR